MFSQQNTMKQNKKKVENKQRLAFFQIFVLIIGTISFSYLVGAVDSTIISPSQWTSICSGIDVGTRSDGTANLETIKNLEGIQAITGLTPQLINTIDEQSIVENCADKPDALKKLNDKTLLTGIDKNPGVFNTKNSKVFDEISKRMQGQPSTSSFFKEFNLEQNNLAREGWLDKFDSIKVTGSKPPKILSYKEGTKILELGTDKWKRTIDTEGLKGKIKLTTSENGDIWISDGTTITGNGNAKIEYDKGLGRLKITAGADTTVDFSEKDFSQPMSNVNVVSKGATVKTTDADYSGVFEGKFTGSSKEFTQIGTDGVNILDDYGNFLAKGNKMTIDNDGLINIDGEFKDIRGDSDTIKSTNAFISRDNTLSSKPDAMNVKLDADGLVTEANVIGSGKGTIEGSGFKNLKIDTSQATEDGLLTLDNNGNFVEFENGKILNGEELKDILAEDGKINYQYSPGKTQTLENVDGIIKSSIKDTPAGQIATPEKSGLRKVWDKYKWPIIVVAAAAAALGAFMLFKKKKDAQKEKEKEKDKDKKKNETSNSSK